jgi:hypothetical protein
MQEEMQEEVCIASEEEMEAVGLVVIVCEMMFGGDKSKEYRGDILVAYRWFDRYQTFFACDTGDKAKASFRYRFNETDKLPEYARGVVDVGGLVAHIKATWKDHRANAPCTAVPDVKSVFIVAMPDLTTVSSASDAERLRYLSAGLLKTRGPNGKLYHIPYRLLAASEIPALLMHTVQAISKKEQSPARILLFADALIALRHAGHLEVLGQVATLIAANVRAESMELDASEWISQLQVCEPVELLES